MILGKVIGNVVSTVMAPGYESKKLLIIQPVDPGGKPLGKSFLAVDTVQAGVGDLVITLDEGNSARALLKEPNSLTIKLVVAGIVDEVSL
jgi:microcompartment protein CcmK/EutM